jgi:ribose 1,5-bisphosphokinase
MKGRLIYVVGPSGSGKDSVIQYARERLSVNSNVVFAQRTITRPASAGGEDHTAATEAEFGRLLAAGRFSMHWRANGLAYGIGSEIRDWLAAGRTVVVSGSRAHISDALEVFPRLEVVMVTASFETLKSRLDARGRENATQVSRRLERGASIKLPSGTHALEIRNDGAIAESGARFLAFLG